MPFLDNKKIPAGRPILPVGRKIKNKKEV